MSCEPVRLENAFEGDPPPRFLEVRWKGHEEVGENSARVFFEVADDDGIEQVEGKISGSGLSEVSCRQMMEAVLNLFNERQGPVPVVAQSFDKLELCVTGEEPEVKAFPV